MERIIWKYKDGKRKMSYSDWEIEYDVVGNCIKRRVFFETIPSINGIIEVSFCERVYIYRNVEGFLKNECSLYFYDSEDIINRKPLFTIWYYTRYDNPDEYEVSIQEIVEDKEGIDGVKTIMSKEELIKCLINYLKKVKSRKLIDFVIGRSFLVNGLSVVKGDTLKWVKSKIFKCCYEGLEV